jgi:uncharacterized protein YbjT (DUF2867 family)
MKVLIAGANSYIGTRLIPVLVGKGYEVVCLSRDKDHFLKNHPSADAVTVVEGDLLRRQSMINLPDDITAAFYLVTPFAQATEFAALGALSAQNFIEAVTETNCQQIIALSDIINQATPFGLQEIAAGQKVAITLLNTATITGPASIALEMFLALTGKAPVLIPQNWMKTRLQPVALADVLYYLEACLLNNKVYNRKFDIGGPDILTFKQMLLTYIAIYKNYRPGIMVLPFLTTQLSSHLLGSLAPEDAPEAQNLLESLKQDTICRENLIKNIIPLKCATFKQALRSAKDAADAENFQTHSY